MHEPWKDTERRVGDDERTQTKDDCFRSVFMELLQLLLIGGNDSVCHVQTVREVDDDTSGQVQSVHGTHGEHSAGPMQRKKSKNWCLLV